MHRKWTRAEDAQLKTLVGQKTASEIAAIMGRPKNGVHHRIVKLDLDGRMLGESHWNAKLSNLQVQMLVVLHDAGFTVNEIHKAAFNHVSLQTVCDIAAARTRKER